MPNEAANIGANFSNYRGDPNLGGFGLGFGKIDTRPIEDLARYTMLYNKAEYDQRQKDAEKAAEQLADLTALDLSTTIPKDAKILQDRFDALTTYVRENPDALNYKNRKQWLEYNKKKADLMNDVKFAKIRSVANIKNLDAIATEKNESIKKRMEAALEKNIADTDIRTPLNFNQEYDLKVPEIADNKGLKFDVTKAGDNEIGQRTLTLFDMKEGWRNAVMYDITGKAIDPSTEGGQRSLLIDAENPWKKMAAAVTLAVKDPNAPKDKDGNLDAKKMAAIIPGLENVMAYNDYVSQTVRDIDAGVYTDKAGIALSFGQGALRREDYQKINWQDGLDARELGMVAQFSKWAGDQYDTKVIETDNAIQQRGLDLEGARLKENQRQFNLSYGSESADVRDGAYSVLSTIKNAIDSGTPLRLRSTDPNDKNEIRAIQISDANLINKFRLLSKDGNTTEVADRVNYYPETKRFELIYFARGDNGEILKSDRGGDIIDNNKTKPISFNDWKTNLIRDDYDAKTKGRINNIVSKELDAFSGDLIEFSKNFNKEQPIEEKVDNGKTEKTIKSKSGKTIYIPD